jgi:hypothetical protein
MNTEYQYGIYYTSDFVQYGNDRTDCLTQAQQWARNARDRGDEVCIQRFTEDSTDDGEYSLDNGETWESCS